MRTHIFYNTVNFQPVTFRILFFRGIQTLQIRLSRKACFWWTQLLRPFCRAADELLDILNRRPLVEVLEEQCLWFLKSDLLRFQVTSFFGCSVYTSGGPPFHLQTEIFGTYFDGLCQKISQKIYVQIKIGNFAMFVHFVSFKATNSFIFLWQISQLKDPVLVTSSIAASKYLILHPRHRQILLLEGIDSRSPWHNEPAVSKVMRGAAAHTDLSDKLWWIYLRHLTEHLTTFKFAQTTITKTIPFSDHSTYGLCRDWVNVSIGTLPDKFRFFPYKTRVLN